MLGSATFTIVTSTSSMNVPRQTASSVHHFRSMTVPPPLPSGSPRSGRRPDIQRPRQLALAPHRERIAPDSSAAYVMNNEIAYSRRAGAADHPRPDHRRPRPVPPDLRGG